MKLKKKSKLKAELQELSAKKTSESDSVVVNENITNGASEEHPKRKKSKKHKKDTNEVELQELAAKKTTESDSVANENVPNGVSEEHPKRKKSKKHKKDINENDHPMKKMKIEDASDNDQNVNGTLSNETAIEKEEKTSSANGVKKSNAGPSSNSKHALMARLRKAASDFKTCTSLLHVQKHKSNNDDDSDDGDEGKSGNFLNPFLQFDKAYIFKALVRLYLMSHLTILVADITPEVRRQMRLKLQAQLKSQPRAHNRAELQERLRLKLEELRGSDKSASKNKDKKKKLTKAEKRSKAKQDKRLKAKLSRGEQKNSLVKVPGGAKPAKPVYNSDGKMVFSKFDFTNGECAIGGGDKKKPVLDPKAALGKIQKHKEKIQSLQAIGELDQFDISHVIE